MASFFNSLVPDIIAEISTILFLISSFCGFTLEAYFTISFFLISIGKVCEESTITAAKQSKFSVWNSTLYACSTIARLISFNRRLFSFLLKSALLCKVPSSSYSVSENSSSLTMNPSSMRLWTSDSSSSVSPSLHYSPIKSLYSSSESWS